MLQIACLVWQSPLHLRAGRRSQLKCKSQTEAQNYSTNDQHARAPAAAAAHGPARKSMRLAPDPDEESQTKRLGSARKHRSGMPKAIGQCLLLKAVNKRASEQADILASNKSLKMMLHYGMSLPEHQARTADPQTSQVPN